jgi:hypothetical protein
MVALMIRTGIPVSVWEAEGPDVVGTALDLLAQEKGAR